MSLTLSISTKLADYYAPAIRSASETLCTQFLAARRYGDYVDLDIGAVVFKPAFLEEMYAAAQPKLDRSMMIQITGFRSLRDAPKSAKLGRKLQPLVVGLASFMQENLIDGWLYEKTHDGRMLPWLVTSVEFRRARDVEDRDSVTILLKANSASAASFSGRERSDVVSRSKRYDYEDVSGKTIPEILADSNLFHESQELRAIYDEELEAFHEYQPMAGKQFLAWGAAGVVDTDGWWRSGRDQRTISSDRPIRVVNDESIITRHHVAHGESQFLKQYIPDLTVVMPYHPFICCFALDSHQQHWFHSSSIRPYEYTPSLRDKLILPQNHRDLIDLLTADDGGQSDLIVGKGQGTTILCLGKPGTGKTLTAEVYSEVVEKPLYSVHSGQLGTSGDLVEKKLKEIFARVARWDAILLIDEADVYIRVRDNDTEHNAIVASFLRTMEYFTGLMFMTSNRSDDVDDAIISRAAAIIRYEVPRGDVAAKIWQTHAEALSLGGKIKEAGLTFGGLTETFPAATGRDIRNILALSARVIRGTERALDEDLLRQCAMFKGVI